jgi:hypothetical protein
MNDSYDDCLDAPRPTPPRDTRRDVLEGHGGVMLLAAAMGGGAERAFDEAQRAGQGELVAARAENVLSLPTALRDPRELFEAMGLVFGETPKDDPMFTPTTVPEGWSVVDDRGRPRASIFYKAAFWDREAFMRVLSRFRIERDYESADARDRSVTRMRVYDAALPGYIHTVEGQNHTHGEYDHELDVTLLASAETWLSAHHPTWKQRGGGWD